MRILLLGPTGTAGSLPPYLDVLAQGLRLHGARVHRHGSCGVPYDTQTGQFWDTCPILRVAEDLAASIDVDGFDVISLHFGNLEIEQVLPLVWANRGLPPVVYHVHSLDWTLFTHHVPEPTMRAAVDAAVSRMDGFVFFGAYGKNAIEQRYAPAVPMAVSWLPTTIPAGKVGAPSPRVHEVLTRRRGPVASLYGYAAPWKDPATLITAYEAATSRFHMIVAGPYWDDAFASAITHDGDMGYTQEPAIAGITCLPTYLNAADRHALVERSDVGVFPYRPVSTFQGSGAVADYLAHGTPLIGTDMANMAELIGDAGTIVTAGDPAALAAALDRYVTDAAHRDKLAQAARRRARQFTAANHAAQCLHLYDQVIARSRASKATRSAHVRN